MFRDQSLMKSWCSLNFNMQNAHNSLWKRKQWSKKFQEGQNKSSDDWQLQFKEEKGKYSVFTAYSAQPARCLSSTPAAWGLSALSVSLSVILSRSSCDKESLSLEPCHRSRKWFLPQVGGADRERKRRETKREREITRQGEETGSVVWELSV